MELQGSLLCLLELTTGPFPEPDASIPHPHTVFPLRSILILCSHLHFGLQHGLFPSGFLTKILHALPFSSMCTTCSVHCHLVLLDLLDHSDDNWWRVQLIELRTVQSSPASCPVRSKYIPQHTFQQLCFSMFCVKTIFLFCRLAISYCFWVNLLCCIEMTVNKKCAQCQCWLFYISVEANSRKKKVYEQQENEENPLRCPVKLYEFYLSKW